MRPLRFDTQQWVIQPDTSPVSHHARHAITRRAFIGSMAVVAGATAGVGLIPVVARAAKPSSTAPVPTSVTQVIPRSQSGAAGLHPLAISQGIPLREI